MRGVQFDGMLPELNLIKGELQSPYWDPRVQMEPMHRAAMFRARTGWTRNTLRPGVLVEGTVSMVKQAFAIVRIDGELGVRMRAADLGSLPPNTDPRNIDLTTFLNVDKPLMCRVTEVWRDAEYPGTDHPRLRRSDFPPPEMRDRDMVKLSCHADDIDPLKRPQQLPGLDWYCNDQALYELEVARTKATRTAADELDEARVADAHLMGLTHRQIVHENFHNVTAPEAMVRASMRCWVRLEMGPPAVWGQWYLPNAA